MHIHVYHPQVLSESVSKALQLVGGVEAAETSKFVGMMDKFFDILNVHNYTHGVHARKPFQMPYTTSKDKRLKVIHVVSYFITQMSNLVAYALQEISLTPNAHSFSKYITGFINFTPFSGWRRTFCPT